MGERTFSEDEVVGLMQRARRDAEERSPQFGRTKDEMRALIVLLDEIEAKEHGLGDRRPGA